MIKDIFKYSTLNLWHRKTRSLLSILSILIGITAIFALSSFGLGIKLFVENYAKQMGTDKIIIMPKDYLIALGKSNIVLTKEDLDFLKKINGVSEATGMMAKSSKVQFKNYREKYPFVIGISTEPEEKRAVEEMFSVVQLEKGRDLKKGDILKAVLGYSYLVPNRLFEKSLDVGDKIKINDVEVQAVGFYEEIGSPEDDAQIYISHEGYKEIFKEENYFWILLRASPDQDIIELATRIKEKFRKYKSQKEGEEDFFVQTFDEMMQTYTSIINILVGILVLIALISIVVAAVNIMNTMYTSILERTKEIGVMKAIGAKNKFIMFIFVIESGILGLLGGIVGIIFGYGIAKLGEHIAKIFGLALLKPAFPAWLIVGCLLFSFIVGSGSGALPSYQASRLSPVDALRYE